MNEHLILQYFPNLTPLQEQQIKALYELYKHWNQKINVISRKDIDNLYLHHVLHSMSIAKEHAFPTGSMVMDLGCGGGFPGIPLAILFPETQFKMVDSIGKKLTVVNEVSRALSLQNIETFHARAEQLSFKVDYVVSRAVTNLEPFMRWCWNKILPGNGRGVLYLKGGDIMEEVSDGIKGVKGVGEISIRRISDFFEEDFFDTKKIVYIRKR